MLDLTDTLNTTLLDAAAQPWVLLALLLLCAVDGVFPPVPSESLVIGLSAIAAATGAPSVWLILLVGAAGATLGDLTAYSVGRRVGSRRFAWMRGPRIAPALERSRLTLRRRGALVLISGRFVPVARVLLNLTAGATGMPLRRYLPLCVAAGLVWSSFGVGVGLIGGTWVRENPLLGLLLAIALGVALGSLVDRLVQRFTLEPGREGRRGPGAREGACDA